MGWFNHIFGKNKFKIGDLDRLIGSEDLYQSMSDLHDVIAKACDHGAHLERLSLPQKHFYFVQDFWTEVSHGGLDAVFFNSTGSYVHETLEALKIINAPDAASTLQEAVDQFPNGYVPK